MREPSEKAIEAARAVIDKHDTVCSGDHCRGVVEEAVRAAYAVDFPVRDGDLRERVARAIAKAAGAKCFQIIDSGKEFLHYREDCDYFRRLADAALGEVGDGEARLRKALEEIAALDGGYPDDYCEIARKALDAGSSPSPAEPLDRVLEAVADCWLAGIATTAIIDAIRFHERDSAADSGGPVPSPAEKECPEGCEDGHVWAGTEFDRTYVGVCSKCRVPSSPADEVTVRVSREDAHEAAAYGRVRETLKEAFRAALAARDTGEETDARG